MAPRPMEPDLLALVAEAGLAGRVEEGLLRCGVETMDDFTYLRSEEELVKFSGACARVPRVCVCM